MSYSCPPIIPSARRHDQRGLAMKSIVPRTAVVLLLLLTLARPGDADEASVLETLKKLGAKQALGIAVNLDKSRVRDSDLVLLTELKGLVGVSLANTAVTDVGLRELA